MYDSVSLRLGCSEYSTPEIASGSLEFKVPLGAGSSGVVFLALLSQKVPSRSSLPVTSQAQQVAVKHLHQFDAVGEISPLIREMTLLSRLSYHANIVELLACCTLHGPSMLVFEYANLGNFEEARLRHVFTTAHLCQFGMQVKMVL